jgi:hypothetical protein
MCVDVEGSFVYKFQLQFSQFTVRAPREVFWEWDRHGRLRWNKNRRSAHAQEDPPSTAPTS